VQRFRDPRGWAVDELQRRVGNVRASRTELENHLIDELAAGRISRREFIRRGTVLGMSVGVLGFLAAACGQSSTKTTGGGAATVKKGGTMSVGIIAPTAAVNPLTVADEGGWPCSGRPASISPGLTKTSN
jgi:peptide/nickel transport system substrate-binding protein